ncbi:MAG: D-alanine--D-alanine ligase family protein [Cyclobacteriaceae bacterium]
MQHKIKIAILFGGRSVEHEISLRSAVNVVKYIDKDRFDIILIGIDKSGKWFLTEKVDANFSEGKALGMKLDAQKPAFIVLNNQQEIAVDLVFPVLHGTDGEDGSIQGLLKSCDMPMVGTGVTGSAISMDKIISKKLLQAAGVPVAEYLAYDIEDRNSITFEHISSSLGLPFMIKSAALGSSVGVTKVKSADEFLPALEESFRYGDKVLFESFVKGKELECAILGNIGAVASEPGEIILLKDYDFYTYEAKYQDEKAIEIVIPAKISAEQAEAVKKYSLMAYKICRCEDFSRVDVFLADDGRVLINEINTIPGFTSASMFPMLWENKGIAYTELISKLIDLALEKNRRLSQFATNYDKA